MNVRLFGLIEIWCDLRIKFVKNCDYMICLINLKIF